MDVREKLIELLTDNLPRCGNLPRWDNPLQLSCDEQVQRIADHLIMNGVTVQECKLGVKKTNADRIRAMSDEELAMFLCNFRSCNADEYICEGCKAEKYCRAGHEGTIDWLQQPAEEIDDG